MNLPPSPTAGPLKNVDKQLSIRVVSNNRLSPITAAQDRINGSGIFDS